MLTMTGGADAGTGERLTLLEQAVACHSAQRDNVALVLRCHRHQLQKLLVRVAVLRRSVVALAVVNVCVMALLAGVLFVG